MLYIFDKDDNFKNIITEDTGLIDTWFKDYQNHLIDEPFVFHVDSESELLPLIVEENQVAFKNTFHALQDDFETFKLMRIKEIDEVYNSDGYIVRVQCEPSWLELYDHFIEDKRISNGNAQTAMGRALEGSRWSPLASGSFGNGSTNFYWIDAVEALFKIADEWGGILQDYITLDDNNEIAMRIMFMFPRLGRDNGLLIQPGYNAETIERRTLSYPVTAIWGQGASLEIEDEEGQHTGGYTRYITFEDVEWKKSKGDPVDKPKGQKWVGDPQALAKYGYLKDDGTRMHRFGHFSNQDYETPEELLWATWEALQKEKEPEVYHEAVIDEVDKDVFLGDTATILDRHYGKPIEVQSQITGLEYDILRPTENVKTVLGNYKDMSRDPLEDEIDEIKQNQKRPVIVDKGNFRNKKPMKPTNVEAVGGWETIQVTWDYTDEIYVSHYEVYASQNKDFVPDSQFLVYNGKVSAFGHEVKTDEVWYYRVCAVNYHGVKSEFSDEASASTIRIPLDATNFESIVTDAKNRADEAFDNANIATQNAADAIAKAQDGFDKATDALGQSNDAFNLAQESFDKALESIDSFTTLAEFVDENTGQITSIKGSVQGLQTSVGNVEEDVSTLQQTVSGFKTTVSNMQGDLTSVTQIAQGLDVRVTDNENNITNLQITSQGISGQLQSVNTRLDELDSDDRNLITHLPANWESGYINNATGGHVSNNTTLRTIDYYEIKPNEEYILQTYGNYEIVLVQFDSSKNSLGLSNAINAGKSFGDVVFTSHNDARYYRAYFRRLNDSHEELYPDMVGTTLKAKLHMGNEPVEWTPNIMDTGELVNQVQSFVHDFNVTAQGLASRISDNEGNINQLVSTVDGTQQTISNMQGDISTITNLANVNKQTISNLDGDVNSLTQTVDATVSRLENMSGNMITHNVDEWEQGFYNINGDKQASSTSIRTIDMFAIDQNRTYTVSSYGNYNVVISLYTSEGEFVRRISTDDNESFTTANNERRYTVYASTSRTTGESLKPADIGITIKAQLERGEHASDWKDHAGDTYSQYSQLQDAINLRVAKGDVMSQINIEADRVLISTDGKLVLDAESTLISNAIIKNAHIESLSGQKIISKSVIADKLDVTDLSSITARLGTVTSGRLLSQNNNMDLNLNEGSLVMRNANFTLGGGAEIRFTSSGNKMTYSLYDSNSGFSRIAGFGVGNALGGRYPFAHMGTTGAGEMDTLSKFYSGFIANTTARISEGGANSVSGYRFQLRNEAVEWTKGMVFDWTGSNPSIDVFSASDYDYTIGTFERMYTKSGFSIRHYYNTAKGWKIETDYSGNGDAIALRGINSGSYNYQIGSDRVPSRILNIYLRNNPDVLSDGRLKTDIYDLGLGLDFINRIEAKQFRLIPTEADINQGVTQNKLQYGIIAQQVNSVLADFGVSDSSLITQSDDGYYGAQYEQFIPTLIKSVQELDDKIVLTREELVLKIAKLEQRISELECAV